MTARRRAAAHVRHTGPVVGRHRTLAAAVAAEQAQRYGVRIITETEVAVEDRQTGATVATYPTLRAAERAAVALLRAMRQGGGQ